MKKLIAYSSVAHMAFVTFGLFAFNRQGIEGAMMVMLSHGLVSGALFLCVGVIYDRLHTREIARYGGLSDNMPKYALLFMVFTMASVGLPGTSGFVGEFLSLVGTLRGVELGGDRRHHRHHPRRGLHALPLLAHLLRPAGPCRRRGDEGFERARSVAARRRSPRPCSGWASIRKASCARCAPTSAACSSGSSAPSPPGDAHLTAGQAAPPRPAPRGSALMNLAPILPELILTVGAIVLMMVAAFLGRRGSALCSWASVALLLGALGRADRRAAERRRAVRRAARRRRLRRVRQADHLPLRRGRDHHGAQLVRARISSMAPNIRC